MRSTVCHFVVGMLAVGCMGCDRGSYEPDWEGAPASGGRPGISCEHPEHDLGTLVASGDAIEHRFVLINSGDKPVSVLEAWPAMPCCSSIEAPAEPIAPGQRLPVRVVFRPGRQAGPVALRFGVKSDESGATPLQLVLKANVLLPLEALCVEGCGRRLRLGETGQQLVAVRRPIAEGGIQMPPDILEPSAGLVAVLESHPPNVVQQQDGWKLTEYRVRVTLPAGQSTGSQRGALRVGWKGGPETTCVMAWEVVPSLMATPAGLVLRSDATSRSTILIQSTDEPFRILEATGGESLRFIEPEFPTNHGVAHQVVVDLTPVSTSDNSPIDLVLHTDHPRQERVVVSVLRTP